MSASAGDLPGHVANTLAGVETPVINVGIKRCIGPHIGVATTSSRAGWDTTCPTTMTTDGSGGSAAVFFCLGSTQLLHAGVVLGSALTVSVFLALGFVNQLLLFSFFGVQLGTLALLVLQDLLHLLLLIFKLLLELVNLGNRIVQLILDGRLLGLLIGKFTDVFATCYHLER